jgi:NAD(P)-dependent dehydrogenase (short-subunit alcohol dehydrogenase family)
MPDARVVLITGASSGIGQAIAEHLAKHSLTVFGTSRDPTRHQQPIGWNLIQLDVCSDESVTQCVKAVMEKAGRLDVLVNNAGYGLDGALEEATLDQVKSQFETNYFGMLRLTKAVLPLMRAQSGGRIINISAGNASFRLPFLGHYTATKCAMEGYSDILRQEVKPFCIHVSVIEPGFLKTNIGETVQLGEDRIIDYEPWRTRWLGAYRESLQNAPAPTSVAQCVFQILSSNKPRFLYIVGLKQVLGVWLHRLLPEGLFRLAMKKFYRIGSRNH